MHFSINLNIAEHPCGGSQPEGSKNILAMCYAKQKSLASH